MNPEEVRQLDDLSQGRAAPALSQEQRLVLQSELRRRVAACDWFTIGVMAPRSRDAWQALREFEQALGWSPLTPSPASPERGDGPVFLKGHQRTGLALEREETGLGEGVLVTGHSDSDPAVEATWGPLPLDFFRAANTTGHGEGASGL